MQLPSPVSCMHLFWSAHVLNSHHPVPITVKRSRDLGLNWSTLTTCEPFVSEWQALYLVAQWLTVAWSSAFANRLLPLWACWSLQLVHRAIVKPFEVIPLGLRTLGVDLLFPFLFAAIGSTFNSCFTGDPEVDLPDPFSTVKVVRSLVWGWTQKFQHSSTPYLWPAFLAFGGTSRFLYLTREFQLYEP